MAIPIARMALAMLLLNPLMAQGIRKSMQAVRTREIIRLDGHLDEGIWSQAPAASHFTVDWPDRGKPSTRHTEVKVLYDDHCVYVGAQMHHPKGKAQVTRQVHRRDQDSRSDWFAVAIDSLHDRRTAFFFSVNASGVQRDGVFYADTNMDASWDGVWESAVSVDADGWTAELKIPLSLLRIHASSGPQTWGINFYRQDMAPDQEQSLWEVVPRGINAYVSYFPELTGIEGIQPQPRREWIPYVSTMRKFETTQSYDDRKWTRHAGLDAHLGLNSYSQLDLTLRPDFGQVEVDQAVLNLGTIETYFPEKRPFFLEGMEIFQLAGPQLFYSRRIGKGLDDPDLNDGETLMGRPAATDILGAAKITSKFSNGLNLGVLAANVEPAQATIQDASGRQFQREISPTTTATVARATQSLNDRGSYIGGFVSYWHEAGVDGRKATVGAVDGSYKSPDGGTTLEYFASHSDAGPADDKTRGHFERARFMEQWKSGWTADLVLTNASRHYDPNDLGYLSRADRKNANFNLDCHWDEALGMLKNRQWHLNLAYSEDQSGRILERWGENWFSTEFENQWSGWLGFGGSTPSEDDRELRTFDDPVKKYLHWDSHPWYFFGINTPANRPWMLTLRGSWDHYRAGFTRNHSLSQSIRPLANLEIQLDTSFYHVAGERHWLDTLDLTRLDPTDPKAPPTVISDVPIVGQRKLNQLDQTLRISYAFSPTLTVQLFSQWLEAGWNYKDLAFYVSDRVFQPLDSTHTIPSKTQIAFNDRLWNLNLITRWEFRPGSTCYLVYTHGVYTDAVINTRSTLRPIPDLAYLRHLPSDDAVQIKLSWLFR